MDRLSKALLRVLVVVGVLAVASVALAVAEDRTPARAPVPAAAETSR